MAIKQPAKKDVPGVSMGRRDFYYEGGGLPEGKYTWNDVEVLWYDFPDKEGKATTKTKRLGVLLHIAPTDKASDEKAVRTQFYAVGEAAEKMYTNHPTNKYMFALKDNAKGTGMSKQSKFFQLLKSLFDSGLPDDGSVYDDSLEVFVGMECYMQPVPPPDSWKDLPNRVTGTSEADEEEDEDNPSKPVKGKSGSPKNIFVVSQIFKSSWMEAAEVEDKPKPSGKAKAATAAADAEEEQEESDDSFSAAAVAIGKVLGKNPKGLHRAKVRTEAAAIAGSEEAAEAVHVLFGDAKRLAAVLKDEGFVVEGTMIQPE